MLIEAKEQVRHGEWGKWLKRHFTLSHETAGRYMRLAERMVGENRRRRPFRTLSEATDPPRATHQPVWHEPVQKVASRVNVEALRPKNRTATRSGVWCASWWSPCARPTRPSRRRRRNGARAAARCRTRRGARPEEAHFDRPDRARAPGARRGSCSVVTSIESMAVPDPLRTSGSTLRCRLRLTSGGLCPCLRVERAFSAEDAMKVVVL